MRIHELGQECKEEDRYLGVKQIHKDAPFVKKRSAVFCYRCRGHEAVTFPNSPERKIEQIKRTCILKDRKSKGRLVYDCRNTQRSRRCVEQETSA